MAGVAAPQQSTNMAIAAFANRIDRIDEKMSFIRVESLVLFAAATLSLNGNQVKYLAAIWPTFAIYFVDESTLLTLGSYKRHYEVFFSIN
jgi:hypothetical protein